MTGKGKFSVEVVHHEPASWYLLKKGSAYYIDVHCEQSFMSFSLMIELNEEEYTEYHALGQTFLQYFAAKISYWASRYKERNVTGPLVEEATEAIKLWQRQNTTAA